MRKERVGVISVERCVFRLPGRHGLGGHFVLLLLVKGEAWVTAANDKYAFSVCRSA